MVLDKALPEKFVFAVIKKSESAELSKKRFDLVKKKQNQRQKKRWLIFIVEPCCQAWIKQGHSRIIDSLHRVTTAGWSDTIHYQCRKTHFRCIRSSRIFSYLKFACRCALPIREWWSLDNFAFFFNVQQQHSWSSCWACLWTSRHVERVKVDKWCKFIICVQKKMQSIC